MLRSAAIITSLGILAACSGREPSNLLRQGQLPINDFPLYVTDGNAVKSVNRNGAAVAIEISIPGEDDAKTPTPLKNLMGIATDRFQNVFVVGEIDVAGGFTHSKVVRFDGKQGAGTVIYDPCIISGQTGECSAKLALVAVNSVGEVFVTDDKGALLIRVKDGTVVKRYVSPETGTDNPVTGLEFGVDDIPIVAIAASNKVYWGDVSNNVSADVLSPVGVSVDVAGRVYVAGGDRDANNIFQFNQREPGSERYCFPVAACPQPGDPQYPADTSKTLAAPQGIAVDSAGNIFIADNDGTNRRIVLIKSDKEATNWLTGLNYPRYLAFTKY